MGDSILKRTITSLAVVFAVFIVTFIFPDWAFCLLVVLFISMALYEFFSILEKKGLIVYKYFGTIAGSVIPVAVYLHLGGKHANLEPFFIVIACLFTFVLQFTRRESKNDRLTSIALTLFALFYISWFLSFFVKIKFLPCGGEFVAFLILVTKMGDVGAYVIGKAYGKSPLIPRISPNKTKEGAIGGLLFSIVTAVVLGFFLVNIAFIHVIILGFLLGVLGQVGDLAESLFKRDFDIKDSGGRLPGLGGILDVMDSLLFTAPIFYFYVAIIILPAQ